jgi:NTE family protein
MQEAGGTALVLGAGGIAGAFQAGAILEALERKENAPDAIFGCSAGALNGAFLADRAGRMSGPINWSSVAQELAHFWRERITGPDVIWHQRRDVIIAGQICTNNFQGLLDTDASPPRSLMRNIIRAEISPDNLRKTAARGTIYFPGAVDMFTGSIEYPPPSDEEILDLIIASTAIPVAMDCVIVPRSYDMEHPEHPFVDGGTRDVAPLSRAIKAGYRRVVCVACQAYKLEYRTFPPRNLKKSMPRVMNIVINETVNNDLRTICRIKGLVEQLKKGGLSRDELDKGLGPYFDLESLTIIRPQKEIEYDDLTFTSAQIADMIDNGIKTARTVLESAPQPCSDETLDRTAINGGFTVDWRKR